MLTFRRITPMTGEHHAADLTGPNGEPYSLRLYKLPRERKWTAILMEDDRVIHFKRRFVAPTAERAAETAVNLLRDHLETQAALASAILPQIAVPSKRGDDDA